MKKLPLSLALVLAATAAQAASTKVEPFDQFADKAAEAWVRTSPTEATASQYFSGEEQKAFDRQLIATDGVGLPIDPGLRAAKIKLMDEIIAGAKRYKVADLTPTQRISAASLIEQLEDHKASIRLADDMFIFDQFRGMQVGLVNFLSQTHPVRNRDDVASYLARLKLVGGVIDQGIIVAKAQEQKGILPPKFIIQATIDGLDRFLSDAPDKNVLVASLAARMAKIADYPSADRDAALAQAQASVTSDVVPAYRRVRDMLAAQLPKATDDAGMWRLPNGAEAYRVRLRSQTTTELTPDQIHEIGLKQVAKIEGEMDQILKSLGLTEGSVQARHDQLEKQLEPPADPDPRPMILDHAREILADAQKRADAIFDLRPKAPVQVLREPPFTERSAAAHYSFPAPDGSRPGTVWLPLPGPEYKSLELRSLIYHEGVPGHHFQIALQQELPEVPRFRQKRVFGGVAAFAEGWALYAEHLAAEQGWYADDPKGHLGQLYDELFRARRLVVDTGLHAKHWTRQQGIDFGIPVSEVERYVVMPGQACAYMIGELQILELRDKAKAALGDKFTLKGFHNLLLSTGTVPLSVLKQAVDDYIAKTKA